MAIGPAKRASGPSWQKAGARAPKRARGSSARGAAKAWKLKPVWTGDSLRDGVQLPASGVGYVTYNRERDGGDQWGTRKTITTIQALGRSWDELYPNRPLEIGDISRRRGGRFEPHSSHQTGHDFDVRPPTLQGGKATWRAKGYDREAARTFVALVKQLVPGAVVYFNDPKLMLPGTTDYSPGHDNHLHVSLPDED